MRKPQFITFFPDFMLPDPGRRPLKSSEVFLVHSRELRLDVIGTTEFTLGRVNPGPLRGFRQVATECFEFLEIIGWELPPDAVKAAMRNLDRFLKRLGLAHTLADRRPTPGK